MTGTADTPWTCTDRTMVAANGQRTPERHPAQPAPLSAAAGLDVVPGTGRAGHADDRAVGHGADDVDCQCDRMPLCWQSCHGCGSRPGGQRHGATVFIAES